MVDMDARREELALTPDSRQGAYCITIRTGLCNAYLAASVIGSKMVSTSKTGVMGAVSHFATKLSTRIKSFYVGSANAVSTSNVRGMLKKFAVPYGLPFVKLCSA